MSDISRSGGPISTALSSSFPEETGFYILVMVFLSAIVNQREKFLFSIIGNYSGKGRELALPPPVTVQECSISVQSGL